MLTLTHVSGRTHERRQIQAGDWIDVEVEITAQHKGYFEFKICPTNDWDQDQDQACFDE